MIDLSFLNGHRDGSRLTTTACRPRLARQSSSPRICIQFAVKMEPLLLLVVKVIGTGFAAIVGFYIVFLVLGAIPFFQRQ